MNIPQPRSYTLASLGHYPNTACANCPNAIWQVTEKDKLRVYCLLMHAFIDEELKVCDGAINLAPQMELEEITGVEELEENQSPEM